MMQLFLYISLIASISSVFYINKTSEKGSIKEVESFTVQEILLELGDNKPTHYIDHTDSLKIEKGRQLVLNGFYQNKNGEKSKRISKYFVCTDCHNLVREHDNLSQVTAEDRLDYAMKHNLAYLPGSTFWGITNREHWYTKDYVKKYGDLVTNAKDTLGNSIQLCAKECSSGRYLENWEEEAILHFMKTLELKVSDLNLNQELKQKLSNVNNLTDNNKKDLIQELKKHYTIAFQATFVKPKTKPERKEEVNGNFTRGEFIYKNSCMHCHAPGRVTNFVLQDLKIDKAFLKSKVFKYTQFSIYEVVRYGFGPKEGMQQYMPLYPAEKLSNQQLEDLVTYLNSF